MARAKACVWTIWAFSALLSIAYCLCSIYSFIFLLQLDPTSQASTFIQAANMPQTWGLFAATIIPFASVGFFTIFSLIVLLGKAMHFQAASGYGFILAAAIQNSMLLLLGSLVLQSSWPTVQHWQKINKLTQNQYMGYTATFVLGYILAGWFVVTFLVLLCLQPAVTHHADKAAKSKKQQQLEDVEAPAAAAATTAATAASLEKPAKSEELAHPVDAHDNDVAAPDADTKKSKGWTFKGSWK